MKGPGTCRVPPATLRALGVLGEVCDILVSPIVQGLRKQTQRGQLCVHGAACVLACLGPPGQEPPENGPLAHMAHFGLGTAGAS